MTTKRIRVRIYHTAKEISIKTDSTDADQFKFAILGFLNDPKTTTF